jgi:hypothetical protein
VIVDHAHRLHERVANRRTDEAKTALLQLLAHRHAHGLGMFQGYRSCGMRKWLSFDETPDEFVETSELFLSFEERLCVLDGGVDLQAIADNAFVLHQLGLLGGAVFGDLFGVEVVEGLAVVFALFEDRQPAEASLGAFEIDHFEEVAVIVADNTPFLVVIGNKEVVRLRPAAAFLGHNGPQANIVAYQGQ